MVVATEAKRFTLIFPKGRGSLSGWGILVEKLRLLGVTPMASFRRVVAPIVNWGSSKEATEDLSFANVVRKNRGSGRKRGLDRNWRE